jgi:AbiV family abortive infection protein
MFTSDSLGRGAWYSLEQCGHFLEDAVEAYHRARWMTGVALALMAREELGKHKILLSLRKSGQSLTLRELNDKITQHVEKQKRGQLTTILGKGEGERRFIKELLEDTGISEDERRQRLEQLHELTKRVKNRSSTDRYRDRMKAVYVDAREDGDWMRPCTAFTPRDAYIEVAGAVGDYLIARMEIDPTFLHGRDLDLARAIEAWTERPELPDVPRPKCPW